MSYLGERGGGRYENVKRASHWFGVRRQGLSFFWFKGSKLVIPTDDMG